MPNYWVIMFAIGVIGSIISGHVEVLAIGCFLIAHAAYNEK